MNKLLAIDAWMGVLAFSGQIFFDFAGYSTCAIGIAICLGFVLPQNFKYPYAATGFSDFWRRWHITLSLWLRDYLYIPLGGNRKGEGRTYVNLMITMLLGGLWHGASWTFVVWGALHGIYLCVERWVQEFKKRRMTSQPIYTPAELEPSIVTAKASFLPSYASKVVNNKFLLALFIFFLVNIAWVFFRAEDFATAWRLLGSMFGMDSAGAPLLQTIDIIVVAIVTVGMLATHWYLRNRSVSQVAMNMNWVVLALIWTVMILMLILSQKSSDSFIYFQF